MIIEIWQLKPGHPCRFIGTGHGEENVISQGGPHKEDYDFIWEDYHDRKVEAGDEFGISCILEDIFYKYNMEIPEGYTGHSLSVSDIVVLKDTTNKEYVYFVDTFGFVKTDWLL